MCHECRKLEAERQLRQRMFAIAVTAMNSVATSSDDGGEYLRLRSGAHEALENLARVEIRLGCHREMHPVLPVAKSLARFAN